MCIPIELAFELSIMLLRTLGMLIVKLVLKHFKIIKISSCAMVERHSEHMSHKLHYENVIREILTVSLINVTLLFSNSSHLLYR